MKSFLSLFKITPEIHEEDAHTPEAAPPIPRDCPGPKALSNRDKLAALFERHEDFEVLSKGGHNQSAWMSVQFSLSEHPKYINCYGNGRISFGFTISDLHFYETGPIEEGRAEEIFNEFLEAGKRDHENQREWAELDKSHKSEIEMAKVESWMLRIKETLYIRDGSSIHQGCCSWSSQQTDKKTIFIKYSPEMYMRHAEEKAGIMGQYFEKVEILTATRMD